MKGTAEEVYDSAKGKVSGAEQKIKGTAEQTYDFAKHKVSGPGHKIKEGAEQTYDSAKRKIPDNGSKFKEIAGETYDSATGKIADAGLKIKESAEQTYDSAKDKVSGSGAAKDDSGHGKDSSPRGDLRMQQALRHAGEAAIEKFRQAMDEVYSMSTNGAEKKFIPLFSEDVETNVGRTGARTADLVKETAENLTGGSTTGSHLMASRFERLTSRQSLKVGARILHLLAFSTIYGSSVWVNFLSGHILAATIPRQQFALIQSKMYPIYFNTMAYGLATCLLTHSAIHPWKPESKFQSWQGYTLLISLLFTLVDMLVLEPRTTKVIFEKLRIEKEEGRGTDIAAIVDHPRHRPASGRNGDDVTKYRMVLVNRKLKLLHRVSSSVNMLTFMSLSWHLVYLSSYIKS
ncbi:hypothetical protein KI387_015076 [Taxus chinensis]|uniref:TMEM205-like domain-containing protein n=1 Tax=Taxus chinensis TaxID=29808 RepID=A0AA38LH47_TAXCH|nr:hypothetical protein KI387_015076 [Taxus chinensis]